MSQLKTYSPFTEFTASLPHDIPAHPSPLVLDSDTFVGIEIESEGWPVYMHVYELEADYWTHTEDGSLRGPYPTEVYSTPVRGQCLVDALTLYEDTSGQYQEHFTWRCATHVHLNLMEETLQTLWCLVPLSVMTDNFLYAAGQEWRRKNHNCRPLSLLANELDSLAHLTQCFCTGDIQDIDLPEEMRYMGTNWAALMKQGTLEFRHFPGNNKTEQVLRWVNLTQSIVAAARKFRINELSSWFCHDIETFGRSVFGEEWPQLQYSGWKKDWSDAQTSVKYLLDTQQNLALEESFDAVLRQRYVLMGDR